MPGYIQNPYMPQYGGFQYGNYPVQPNAPYQNAIQNQTQQIIQNDNANYRQLHDEIVANRMEDLKSKIADQAQEINQLNLSASQCQQNAYLISQLRPNPVPAFQVANPFASMYTGCCNNNVAI